MGISIFKDDLYNFRKCLVEFLIDFLMFLFIEFQVLKFAHDVDEGLCQAVRTQIRCCCLVCTPGGGGGYSNLYRVGV